MTPLLTIFTPTYNRRKYLTRLYDSLCRQSDKRFLWLVVDDGSTDSTDILLRELKSKTTDFDIHYIYKSHGGLHTAYNTALENCDTYLFVCIDSDDFVTDNAVKILLDNLDRIKNDNIGGFVAPDILLDNTVIGGDLPDVDTLHFGELTSRYKHTGDVKLIYKTAVLKKYAPMPTFGNETTFNPCYMFMQADRSYKMAVIKEPISVVDYSSLGMHTEVFRAYTESPLSYAELRREFMRSPYAPLSHRMRNAVHYVSSCIFAHEKNMLAESPCKLLTILAVPFGVMLNLYIRIKNHIEKK